MKLEEQMSWEELAEYTTNRLRPKLKPKEVPQFKKWFMEREKVGYRFDPVLILRCFRIWQDLKQGLDHFAVLSGREGAGKTTLSFQIGAWVNPNFKLDNVTYGAESYINTLDRKLKQYHAYRNGEVDDEPETETLILDEGTELLSRESLNKSNRILAKSFFVQRVLKFFVIVNIPNFHMLDSVVRMHRVRTLIEVKQRGKYRAHVGAAIKIISEKGAKKKDVLSVRIPSGTFWDGDFRKDFPQMIDSLEYEKHKLKGIDNMITTLKGEGVTAKFIPASQVARELNISQEAARNNVKKGLWSGKQIGARFYVRKDAYNDLIA